MKYFLGKVLLNLGPVRTRYFCDKRAGPSNRVLSHFVNYGKIWLRTLVNSVTKNTGKTRGSGAHGQITQIAYQSSTHSGAQAAASSIIRGTQQNPKWKTLFNQVIAKCSVDSLAAELRRNAAKRLMFGTGSTFALLGFSLAKEPSLLTDKDQLDVICQEIREAFNSNYVAPLDHPFNLTEMTLKNLRMGEVLEKGCNAVVLSARWEKPPTTSIIEDEIPTTSTTTEKLQGNFGDYDLAVKMMFNYDAESNASAIWKAMYRESVPAQAGSLPEGPSHWLSSTVKLPRHPNIVDMKSAFVDQVPDLPQGLSLYPAALPARLNESGYGRNMTFFMVMKRYDTSLRSYLLSNQPESRTSLVLLSQLIEGLLFLQKHKVAHRDLKSDNILLDTTTYGKSNPLLVITDFGCCLADKDHSLKVSLPNDEIFRGGNSALMAPEVVCAAPGIFSVIDYTKSDLWAAGTIAYEIFGAKNPFYKSSAPFHLVNHNYEEQNLPSLAPHYSPVMSKLVKDMLRRDPKKRLDVIEVADICGVLMHAPTHWLKNKMSDDGNRKSDQEIIIWILALGGVTLYNENAAESVTTGDEVNPIEQMLRSLFLSRVSHDRVKFALDYINA